jgi:hypothetical protein
MPNLFRHLKGRYRMHGLDLACGMLKLFQHDAVFKLFYCKKNPPRF